MTATFSKRLKLDYSNVLVAIFDPMLAGGIRSTDLLATCTHALKQAEAKVRSGQQTASGGLVIAALVLDAWHRDRRYINARALPRAVRLFGPAPSVEALIRRQRGQRNAAEVARHLRTLRLVVPCGGNLYKPTSDVAVISARDPIVLQYAARALSTLLETVGQNVNRRRNLEPLIERIAEVPDLLQCARLVALNFGVYSHFALQSPRESKGLSPHTAAQWGRAQISQQRRLSVCTDSLRKAQPSEEF